MNLAADTDATNQDVTLVRLSSTDWLKIMGAMAAFTVTLAGSAFTAHLGYSSRFTVLEVNQRNVIETQEKMSQSVETLNSIAVKVDIISDRQKSFEAKLDARRTSGP